MKEQLLEWLKNDEKVVSVTNGDNFSLEEVVRWEYCVGEEAKLPDGTLVKSIYIHGGGEGDGETYYIVFQAGDILWRVDGFYQSHHGSELEYDTLREVQAKQKMITVYE